MIVTRGYGHDNEYLGSIVIYGYGTNPLIIAVLIVRNFIFLIKRKVEGEYERLRDQSGF